MSLLISLMLSSVESFSSSFCFSNLERYEDKITGDSSLSIGSVFAELSVSSLISERISLLMMFS